MSPNRVLQKSTPPSVLMHKGQISGNTLTKCSLSEAIRPLGFFPEAIDAIVRLLFRECRDVPFVIVSINPAD